MTWMMEVRRRKFQVETATEHLDCESQLTTHTLPLAIQKKTSFPFGAEGIFGFGDTLGIISIFSLISFCLLVLK